MIKTLKQLEAFEAKGLTCKDCIFYPCCNAEDIPLCYSFEPQHPEPVVSKN
jgi:hypothetical protein